VASAADWWAICKSAPRPRQPCQHPTTQYFTGRMPFLPPNQQRQSTEGCPHEEPRKSKLRQVACVNGSHGAVIRYVLPVLWMTSGCPIMGPMVAFYTDTMAAASLQCMYVLTTMYMNMFYLFPFWPTVLSVAPLVHCVVYLFVVCDVLYCGPFCGETVHLS